MLQQILKDMYVDPDVLDGLNDDQKKTLFLKMRQEQVRRWNEQEEKLEREGGDVRSKREKQRKANNKSVSWLLGRDGDVSVIVIGDELTRPPNSKVVSKFICTELKEKKSPSLQNNSCHQNVLTDNKMVNEKSEQTSVPSKTQLETSLILKEEKCEETSPLPPLAVSAAENAPSAEAKMLESKEKSVPGASICTRVPMRAGAVIVRPTPGCSNTKPGHTNPKLTTTATSSSSSSSTVNSDSTLASSIKGDLCPKEPQKPQEVQGGKGASGLPQRPDSEGAGTSERGRVAQLKKAFSVDPPTQPPPRGIKPALPTKPSHLRLTSR